MFNRSNNGIDFCKTCESDDNCVPGTSCGYYDNDADHKVCCPGATVDYLLTPMKWFGWDVVVRYFIKNV